MKDATIVTEPLSKDWPALVSRWECADCHMTHVIKLPDEKPMIQVGIEIVPRRSRHPDTGLPWYGPVRGGRRNVPDDVVRERGRFGIERGYHAAARKARDSPAVRLPCVVTCWCGTENHLARVAP